MSSRASMRVWSRKLLVAIDALSVALLVPWLFYVSQTDVIALDRRMALGGATAVLVVHGRSFLRWWRKRRSIQESGGDRGPRA